MLVESFVCHRFIVLVESYVYCAFVKLYLLELYYMKTFISYLKTFIRIFYAVIVLYLPEIYLFIYLICLFILFIYQIIIRNMFIKNLSGCISKNFLYIMIYKLDIFEFNH